jgi:cellulose synthase/poly-beta-1,6-N-acetylglucosamine synthase-like glycosyltransferase
VLTAFYILVGLEIVLGIHSLWDGWKWLEYARRRLRTHSGFYTPRVALICPCHGLEPGLEHNLSALAKFDYPNYEIFFAIANGSDQARDVIERVAKSSAHPVHVVVAGEPKDCGEKVNNLLAAIDKIGEEFEALVFADSDARPGRQWLARLVAPLGDARIGAATTFRWLLPERGGFWSALASAWNASAATMLGDHYRNFCWGGGTAIRRKTFYDANVPGFWKGAVSDDYAMTRAIREAGREICFVPECLTPTFYDANANGVIEFTNRQIRITRIYAPRMWGLAAISHGLYCVSMLFAAVAIVNEALTGVSAFSLLLMAMLIPLLAALKGALRAVAASELLPDWRTKVQQWSWVWIALAPLVPFLYLWNLLGAVFSRQIRWRGIRYELISPSQTRILMR